MATMLAIVCVFPSGFFTVEGTLTVMLVNWFRTATVTPSISHRKTALAVPRARAYIGTSTCWCWRKKSYLSAGHAIPGLTSKDTGAGSAGTGVSTGCPTVRTTLHCAGSNSGKMLSRSMLFDVKLPMCFCSRALNVGNAALAPCPVKRLYVSDSVPPPARITFFNGCPNWLTK